MDRLDRGNTITYVCFGKCDKLMRYSIANCHSKFSNSSIHYAVLRCPVAKTTKLMVLSKVFIATVKIPLPIPNREVKAVNADDTAKAGK